MELDTRGSFYLLYVLEHLLSYVVYFLCCVFVFGLTDWVMDLLVETVSVVVLIVFWNVVVYLHPESYSCFIGPTSRYILDGVATSSHHYCW